jgi:hypothetical protein
MGTVLINDQFVQQDSVVQTGDVIETQAGALIVLELTDGSVLEIGENTQLDLAELSQTPSGARVSRVKLLWGRMRTILSPGHQHAEASFAVETPNALVGVKFSQPVVEIMYNPASRETKAFALTVALFVKHLFTGEEQSVPVGTAAVITASGIQLITAPAAVEALLPELQPGLEAIGSTPGIGTGTLVAAGAATAATGALVTVTAQSEASQDTDVNVSGFWTCDSEYWTATLDLQQQRNTVTGIHTSLVKPGIPYTYTCGDPGNQCYGPVNATLTDNMLQGTIGPDQDGDIQTFEATVKGDTMNMLAAGGFVLMTCIRE